MYQQRQVNLSTEQATIYNRLKKRARALIEDKTVSFNNKLTEILRLHQVCQGFLKTDEGTIHEFKNNPKLKELMALLEESDGKVIIWANYVYNIKQIKAALEERYG